MRKASIPIWCVFLSFPSSEQVVPHFLLLALIFMSAYINQKHAVIYGLIFGFLYDINYTGVLGVYMFGFAGLCYLAAKAFKVVADKRPDGHSGCGAERMCA